MSAQERYERSRAAFKRQDLAAALEAIREAIALEPTMSAAHNFAGWILLHLPERAAGDLDQAIAAFREARRLAPTDPTPVTNLCDALLAANRASDAIAIAEGELRRECAFAAEMHNWLGWYFSNAGGDLARAVTHLKEATRERPGWGVARLNLAIALDRSGSMRDAWSAYDSAARIKDTHDPKLARRRRKEIEQEMRARGEEPPKEPWRGMDGEPLGPAYEAIDALLQEQAFDEAIAAIEELAKTDWMATFYTQGLTERAAATAHSRGRREQAKRLADLAVRGARDWASGASSGAEGSGRMYDLQELIKRLARFR